MITRRKFLRDTGALVVFFSMDPLLAASENKPEQALPKGLIKNPQLDSWLRLDKQGKVTVFSGKVELGQGILTAFSQIVAEELDIALERIEIINTDTQQCPDLGYTFGGFSIEHGGSALQRVAAEAKALLLANASARLGKTVSQIKVVDGEFIVKGRPTGLTYWQVLADQRFNTQHYSQGSAKQVSEHSIVGKSIERIDIAAKAFAEAAFIQDLRFPDMLHARIIGAPVTGAKLIKLNFDLAQLPAGQQLIRDGSFLAVVGEREEQVIQTAREVLKTCEWTQGPTLPDENNLVAWLKANADPGETVASRGRSENHRQIAYRAQFSRPFQAHASMAPSMAIARQDGDQITIWSHAQGMFPLRGAIARVLNRDTSKVRCIHVPSCGCYGHNGADDAACDVALIATRVPGRTVRLQYSREDEFIREPYTSAMAVQIAASVNQQGLIQTWDYEIWSGGHSSRPGGAKRAGNFISAALKSDPIAKPPMRAIPQPRGGSDRNAVPIYDLPNMRVRRHLVSDMPLRVSSLRSLGAFTNVIAIESCMDELARASGTDPIDFRLKHLRDSRAIAVLEKLRDVSKWDNHTGHKNQGRGVGFARYKNSAAYCAVAFFLSVDRTSGEIRLERAISVTDAGKIINPDGVKNQVEGGIIQAASWSLKERVGFDTEKVRARHWGHYPVLGFSDIPELDTHLMQPTEESPYGVGEVSSGPAGAAIANAIADALGTRLHDLPFTKETVLATVSEQSTASMNR